MQARPRPRSIADTARSSSECVAPIAHHTCGVSTPHFTVLRWLLARSTTKKSVRNARTGRTWRTRCCWTRISCSRWDVLATALGAASVDSHTHSPATHAPASPTASPPARPCQAPGQPDALGLQVPGCQRAWARCAAVACGGVSCQQWHPTPIVARNGCSPWFAGTARAGNHGLFAAAGCQAG